MLINQIDHEECVLGYALACYNTTAAKAIAMLSPDDMSSASTKWLLEAINKVASKGHQVDVFTVDTERQLAERNGVVPSVCTFDWLIEIAKNSSGANVEAKAKIVRANSAMRKAVERLDAVKAEIIESQDPVAAMQAAKDALMSMDFGVERKKPRLLHDLANEYTESRIKIYEGTAPAGIRLQPSGMSHAFGTIGMSDFIVIAGRPGSGKAMPLSEKILMSDGSWKDHGSINIGDMVASIDGMPSTVTGIFPQGVRDIFKVTFEDGRESICADNHLWEISSCRFKGSKVVDTKELMRLNSMSRMNRRLKVPSISGEFGSCSIGIDGWVLGVLLGDGSLTRTLKFTNSEDYIVDRMRASIVDAEVKSFGGIDYGITTARGESNRMLEYVRSLGLIGCRSYEKFIPDVVFQCDKLTRVSTLCGLLETDGWIEKTGSVMFSSSSERLRDDVAKLAHSLGCVARKTKKENVNYTYNGEKLKGRAAFKLCIRLTNDVSSHIKSPRLLANLSHESRFADASIGIALVEQIGKEECSCIMVSHDRHLYATGGYIMTHNTELSVAVANELAIAQGKAVLYKSLEMDGMELAERALLSLSGLSVDAVETKIFEGKESGFFGRAVDDCRGKPFYVDDSSGCTVDDIVNQCKEFCAEHPNVGALIVDYVGLMEIGGNFSRHDLAIGYITRKLKLLAKEQKIPVIGLFQLSRDVEKRIGNRRPVAADLRDSGSIEQDADKIVIVHRDCINNPQTPMKNVAELLNVKRRRGQPTNGYMEFKNGHFLPIPDEEQARWRITAEESPAPQRKGNGKGLNIGDDE